MCCVSYYSASSVCAVSKRVPCQWHMEVIQLLHSTQHWCLMAGSGEQGSSVEDAHLLSQNLEVYMYKGIKGAAGEEHWVLPLAGCHVCGNIKGHPAVITSMSQHDCNQRSRKALGEGSAQLCDQRKPPGWCHLYMSLQTTRLVSPVHVGKKQQGDAQPVSHHGQRKPQSRQHL